MSFAAFLRSLRQQVFGVRSSRRGSGKNNIRMQARFQRKPRLETLEEVLSNLVDAQLL